MIFAPARLITRNAKHTVRSMGRAHAKLWRSSERKRHSNELLPQGLQTLRALLHNEGGFKCTRARVQLLSATEVRREEHRPRQKQRRPGPSRHRIRTRVLGMTNAEKVAAFRSRAKDAGLCARCGQFPPLPNRTACTDCAESAKVRAAAQRARATPQ